MANFENIAKVRDFLKLQRDQALTSDDPKFVFEMGTWLHAYNDQKPNNGRPKKAHTIAELYAGDECTSVCCVAGTTVLVLEQRNKQVMYEMVYDTEPSAYNCYGGESVCFAARKLLDLTDSEAEHMFYGEWSKNHNNIEDIKIDDVIAYLDLVLEHKDVMVDLDRDHHLFAETVAVEPIVHGYGDYDEDYDDGYDD